MPGPPLQGGTCPFATTGCGGCFELKPKRSTQTCYVMGLIKVYKNVRGVLEYNTKLLSQPNIEHVEQELNCEFYRFQVSVDQYNKKAARVGIPTIPAIYRLHWSGDLFSADYTEAIAKAVGKYPGITFWNYTRSFEHAHRLRNIPNLIQFLSFDDCNLNQFEDYELPGFRFCYMGKAWPNHLKHYAYFKCPVDSGVLPLEGGCAKCGYCLHNHEKNKIVWFES
jgi:hypothetical protein